MDDLVLEEPRYEPAIWIKMVETNPHSYALQVYKNQDIIDYRFAGTVKLFAWYKARRLLKFHRRLNKQTEWTIT
jgi:hypothetical protein